MWFLVVFSGYLISVFISFPIYKFSLCHRTDYSIGNYRHIHWQFLISTVIVWRVVLRLPPRRQDFRLSVGACTFGMRVRRRVRGSRSRMRLFVRRHARSHHVFQLGHVLHYITDLNQSHAILTGCRWFALARVAKDLKLGTGKYMIKWDCWLW